MAYEFETRPVGAKRYVLVNTQNDELYQDDDLTEDEADNLNSKLAVEKSPRRWQPYRERAGDGVRAA